MFTSTNPAITAYKVYYLGQAKLDNECRRQTPDLHRIVAHASIVDSVRRWSRELAEPAETVLVDDSDGDSDPFEDALSDDEAEDAQAIGDVAIFDCDGDGRLDNKEESDSTVLDNQVSKKKPVETLDYKTKSTTTSKRRPPPPPPRTSTFEIKAPSWREHRTVIVRETAIEVDADD